MICDCSYSWTSSNPILFWLYMLNGIFRVLRALMVDYTCWKYSCISLSRPRLSRITAYLEVKIWSLPRHENLTTGKTNIVEKRRNCSKGTISPLFHNIFNISLNSRVLLYIHKCGCSNYFSTILQIWYVEARVSQRVFQRVPWNSR